MLCPKDLRPLSVNGKNVDYRVLRREVVKFSTLIRLYHVLFNTEILNKVHWGLKLIKNQWEIDNETRPLDRIFAFKLQLEFLLFSGFRR